MRNCNLFVVVIFFYKAHYRLGIGINAGLSVVDELGDFVENVTTTFAKYKLVSEV